MFVKATAGFPMAAAGNLTKDALSTATIYGLTNGSTNLGTLTQVAGAYAKLGISAVAAQTAGTAFGFTVTPQDKFGNLQT
jgi:hypothetical protein